MTMQEIVQAICQLTTQDDITVGFDPEVAVIDRVEFTGADGRAVRLENMEDPEEPYEYLLGPEIMVWFQAPWEDGDLTIPNIKTLDGEVVDSGDLQRIASWLLAGKREVVDPPEEVDDDTIYLTLTGGSGISTVPRSPKAIPQTAHAATKTLARRWSV